MTYAQELHWQQPGYIENSFYDIALQSEYSDNSSKLRKWESPVSVWVDFQVGDKQLLQQLLSRHLQHLANITSHPIQQVAHYQQANLLIFFTHANEMEKIVAREINQNSVDLIVGSICLANIKTASDSSIYHAVVVIPVDRARMHGKLLSCIVEELSQVLGLPNDSKQVYPTIFSDRTIYTLLTGLDYLLLKILYADEVKPGMDKKTLSPIIKRILQRWRSDGTINNAEREVKKGGLYELLGKP